MKVFLLRHAPAAYGGPDADRPLTDEGAAIAQALAAFIHGKPYYDFTEIWCSPYLRARQTAAPLAGPGGRACAVRILRRLTPSSDPKLILPELAKAEDSVLLVGHNPHLSLLAGKLLGLDAEAGDLPFKKGALMAFRRDNASRTGYTLAACIPPGAIGVKD